LGGLCLKLRNSTNAIEKATPIGRKINCMLIKFISEKISALRNSVNWCEMHIWGTKCWRKTLWFNYSASPVFGTNQY